MIPIALTRSVRALRLALLLLLPYAVPAQEHPPRLLEKGSWDIGVWIAGATGEENRNSFTEAQIWSAGVFVGKVVTGEVGTSWLRGNLEYGFNLVPIFVTRKTERVYGGGFEPIVVRWISNHQFGRVAPYIELAGGTLFTTSNLPPDDTSSLNFTARGGEGIHIFTKRRRCRVTRGQSAASPHPAALAIDPTGCGDSLLLACLRLRQY